MNKDDCINKHQFSRGVFCFTSIIFKRQVCLAIPKKCVDGYTMHKPIIILKAALGNRII